MNIMDTIRTGVQLLDQAKDAADQFGIHLGPAGTIAGALLDFANQALDKAETGKVILTSQDQDELRQVIRTLRAENDQLAQRIAAS